MFTFNAYAAPGGEDLPGYGKTPRRIAFGDGVMAGFAKIGLDDVAPQASRWAELMADAFSAYFLTHARGESMNWKRVEDFGQMFYQLFAAHYPQLITPDATS